jgi:hypothetical protein
VDKVQKNSRATPSSKELFKTCQMSEVDVLAFLKRRNDQNRRAKARQRYILDQNVKFVKLYRPKRRRDTEEVVVITYRDLLPE